MRALVVLGLFALAFYVLFLISQDTSHQLSRDTLFVAIATSIFGGGGLLAIIGFYFMAAKRDQPGQGGSQ